MPKKIFNEDYEIDLILVFKIIWKSKSILIYFIIISFILSTFLISIQKPKYQSEITLTPDVYSPFYDLKKQYMDFKKLFYDKKVFNDWSNLNNESSISYELLETTNLVDEILFLNNEAANFITIDGNIISIKTNDIYIINDIYNYTSFVNLYLKDIYLNMARLELDAINKLLNQTNFQTIIDFDYFLSLDRFISENENGSNIFIISRPIVPYNTSFNLILIYIISFFICLFIGILFILFRSNKNK